ncbi:hypothetical protein SAMN05421595_2925 [Austwickia chelonae]|nr:hypothetical protein [Austwickia chelonae]SEW42010.1 hypothetical protein SAMN05421595_2925 [Austwickia chelonae]
MAARTGKHIGPWPNSVKPNGHGWAMMFSRTSASRRLLSSAHARAAEVNRDENPERMTKELGEAPT